LLPEPDVSDGEIQTSPQAASLTRQFSEDNDLEFADTLEL